MSETYKELMVKRKKTVLGGLLKVVLIGIAALFLFLGLLGSIPGLLIGVVAGIGAYFAYLNSDLEFEYLYLDKELTIDKIMAKTKRKRVASYSIDRLEIMAPSHSHRLDSYNNSGKKWKEFDFTSKREETKKQCFTMIFEGTTKVMIEADADFVKAIYNNAPRKVFAD